LVGITGAGAMVFVAGATLVGLTGGDIGKGGGLVCAADTSGKAMSKDNEKTLLRFIKFS
jgi:hypothetical protein